MSTHSSSANTSGYTPDEMMTIAAARLLWRAVFALSVSAFLQQPSILHA